MDKLPSGGGAPDGAFERFLTAALATIITIMFSWRLLAEEEEASGATGSNFTSPSSFQMPVNTMKYNRTPLKNNMSSANVHGADIDLKLAAENSKILNVGLADDTRNNRNEWEDVVYDRHDPVQEQPLEAMPSADDNTSSGQDDSLTGETLTTDTLTTWDEYKWEEETGEEDAHVIKTRRNVRDFMSKTNTKSLNSEPVESSIVESQTASLVGQTPVNSSDDSNSSSVSFSQIFANLEYKDGGGDSGYIDLYPDVESDDTESSDDEMVYEIQVSDSDSDSESDHERGGAFFGVTSLDTIMEEYESDASEHEGAENEWVYKKHNDLGDGGPKGEVSTNTGLGRENDQSVDDRNVNNTELLPCDTDTNVISSKLCDMICDTNMDDIPYSGDDQNRSAVTNEATLSSISNDHRPDQISELAMLENKIDLNTECQLQLNEQPVCKVSEADNVKCNLSPDELDNVNTQYTTQGTCFSEQSRDEECDLNLNEVDTINNSNDKYGTLETPSQTKNADSVKQESKSESCQNQNQPNAASSKSLNLKMNDEEYAISEISDDSLPSSPVRTCALDNLTEEPFSDTESCSSESVITVLSVRSNESEKYSDRNNDSMRNPINMSPATRDVTAAGRQNLSTHGNDTNTDTLDSKYDNYSLVSGFLNDSLNSLLSANTGSNENISETESSSGKENTDTKSDIQNGKLTSDDSCVSSSESLPAVTEVVQSNAVIAENGHIDSNDSLNNQNEQIVNEQADVLQNEPNEYQSDGSSDSSDPPLREYDPEDDDLAEFQFDMGDDEDDPDSFYLIIGNNEQRGGFYDDGALRNFDTFTNLNSIGLSPEYGDAVTSHTLADDAHGFKFSRTEELDTQFKKRSYFTDRSNLSDSDGHSGGLLSPITSEDEEIKASDDNKSPITVSVTSPLHANSPSRSAYDDAELSTTDQSHTTENKNTSSEQTTAIDFKKYIIQNEPSPNIESVTLPESSATQTLNNQIDVENSIQDNKNEHEIDTQGDKIVSSGDNQLNNLRDSCNTEETFSSLTAKIELLSHSPQPSDSDQISDTEHASHGITSEPIASEPNVSNEQKSTNVFTDSVGVDKSRDYSAGTIETDIDADFDDDSEIINVSSRTSSRIETNIDDLLDNLSGSDREISSQRKVVDVPLKSRIETNIDDIYEDNSQYIGSNSGSLHETDLDAILNESVNVTENVPTHSTPFKDEIKNKRETNIDDIINNASQTHGNKKHSPTSYRETSVDDLFETPLDSDKTTPSVRQLSYDSFVDDLPESVPGISSQRIDSPPRSGSAYTSESAINVVKEPPILSSSSSASLASKSPEINTRGVQPLNSSEQSEFKQNIDHVYNVNDKARAVNEPCHLDDILNQIVNVDTEDNKQDKKETGIDNTTHTTTPTRQEIGTNNREISTDLYENSNIYDQNNRYIEDSRKTCEINAAISEEHIENDSTNLESVSPTIIGTSLNNSNSVNGKQLDSNLNTPHYEHTDYNANISLPKVETLNNNVHVGRAPETDNKYIEHQVDIPVVTKPQTTKQLHTSGGYSNKPKDGGIQLDDKLLKSEDDSDGNETELKITEDSDYSTKSDSLNYTDENLDSIGSCSLDFISDDESLNSLEESFNSLQDSYTASKRRGLSDSEITARVVRSPVVKPSDLRVKPKDLKGVKKKIFRQQLKKYNSVLQRPITPEQVHIVIEAPHSQPSLSRLKVIKSREKFLSAENVSECGFEDRFLKHRTSFTSSTPRKYLKRNEKTFQQSTESLPADMGDWNACYGSNTSVEHLHSLPIPRQIEELYHSRYSSANSSFERGEYDKLHANCIFSPSKREEIRHTTKSLENMFDQLLRYGSISSLATETDLDADPASDNNESDNEHYYLFQYPLERAASMSAIVESGQHHRLPRKPGKGRFASRNVPKSKSLQTLETNLDDVFTDECEPGVLKKTPSEHELRVSKSLTKLHVPDWFRKSSFSRSDSTQSLFTYARTASTSTIGSAAYPSLASSPSPSVTPGSNAVIIQKRVTPNTTTPPSSRLLRAPMLPVTPERAPIHNTTTPSPGLPSDKFRKQDKKELKPIAIVPFAKLREMFERKAQDDAKAKQTATTPTKEKVKVRFEQASPTKETVIDDRLNGHKPVQSDSLERTQTQSPPPSVPERKPILSHSVRNSESAPRTRTQQVHFSDETNVSNNRSQEQSSNTIRQNGAAPSTDSTPSKPKKPSGLRASLPMPQFRFRRPGVFAKQAAAAAQNSPSSTQSKKGKIVDCNACETSDRDYTQTLNNNNSISSWLHALQQKTKTDGEILFEFLQKQRYSSILENGFAEQLNELQDKGVTYNFPVMTLSRHSNHSLGDAPMDGSHDLQVILTNTRSNEVNNEYLYSKLRSEASVDEILDGLLLLNGHQTGKMRIDENGRVVPRTPEDGNGMSPNTPPGMSLKLNTHDFDPVVLGGAQFGEDYGADEYYMDYVLVKCENSECKRETNLKEAKKYFKSCHNCYTYYCSRTCRKNHWKAHKDVCIYSKISSACKHVIEFVNKQPSLQYQCSRIARRGYLSQGRGCIVFAFPDISSSEDFLISGMESLWVPPVYISLKELPNATMLGSNLGILTQACQKYNPELKYVIHVAIVIPPTLPPKPVPRRMEAIIQKCSILRLSPAHMHPKQENEELSSTLILTAVPGNQHLGDPDERKTRELCFVNIQRKLRNRGVSLRHQFPDVYNRLIDFVADAKHFSPLIIYPSDGRTGKRFMCVIMPEAEPEIEWIRDPDLFHELDVFDDDGLNINNPNLTLYQQPEIML